MQNLQILSNIQDFSIKIMTEKLILGSFRAIFQLFDALESTKYPMRVVSMLQHTPLNFTYQSIAIKHYLE